jgi:hypothetical protein
MSDGTVYVDMTMRNDQGQAMVMGRVLLGHDANIHPRDLGLKLIKSIVFTPWGDQEAKAALNSMGSARRFRVMTGSIGSMDTLDTSASSNKDTGSGNYVRVRTFQVAPAGSIGVLANHGGGVRVYIGTQAGSIRASYIASGL